MKKAIIASLLFFALHLNATDFCPVNYDYLIEKVPKINKGLWEIHFQLYKGYVKQVNLLNRLLEEEHAKPNNGPSFLFQSIKRQFGWEFNGMVLHEYFFSNLGSSEKMSKNSIVYRKIKDQWGNFDKWLDDFKATCMQRGIGWGILYYDGEKDVMYNCFVADHDDGPLVGAAPLLVIDLWEHAYLCQFGTNKGRYIDTIIESVDWNVVNRRMKCAISAQKAKLLRTPKPKQEPRSEKDAEKKSDSA